MCADDEPSLIERARGGDRAAFGQLVGRHQDRIFATLVRTLGSTADAEDVAQTTFLLAWRKLGQFRAEAKLSTWLTQIAVNQAASLRRKRKPPTTLNTEDGPMPVEDDRAATASHRMEAAERDALVQSAINRLSAEHREVLVLKEFGEHDYREISEIVGCPVGTVRSRLHRARSELSDLLAPHRESLVAVS